MEFSPKLADGGENAFGDAVFLTLDKLVQRFCRMPQEGLRELEREIRRGTPERRGPEIQIWAVMQEEKPSSWREPGPGGM